MAELPDLGKHCSLAECQQLDFTPYLCKHCQRFYCGTHRLSHFCPTASSQWDGVQKTGDLPSTKQFMCSEDGCTQRETTKVLCEKCERNYCLRHRHQGDHKCVVEITRHEIAAAKMAEIKEKIENKVGPITSVLSTATPTTSQSQKPQLSDADRKKMEKIAIMKCKMAAKGSVLPAEQRFVFVPRGDKHECVLVSSKWSVSRCVDTVLKQLSVQNENSQIGGKKTRLYVEGSETPLNFEETIDDSVTFVDLIAYVFYKTDV